MNPGGSQFWADINCRPLTGTQSSSCETGSGLPGAVHLKTTIHLAEVNMNAHMLQDSQTLIHFVEHGSKNTLQ